MAKGSGGTRVKAPNGVRISNRERAYLRAYNSNAPHDVLIFKNVYSVSEENNIDVQWEYMAKEYSDEQKKAVIPYIRGSYDINVALDKGTPLNDKQRDIVEKLESSMKPLKKDTKVFMGWVGGKFKDFKSFKSVTMNIKTAAFFATSSGGIKAFIIPKGTKVAFGKSIEQEIILPRDFNLEKHEIK